MIHVFFSKVQIFFKRYFTIYVILDFTPYGKNVSFQFLILINNILWIKKSFYFPQEKNEVDDVNKASETVCALK
jgi:hypothetical protein